jgi:signal transduction histidine kinase
VQQELSAPATAIMGYAEMLMQDAAQAGRVQLIDDLKRILDASGALHRLIESLLDPATARPIDDADDPAELRRTLRHDLRTPINAIKGYAEMLREDAADTGAELFVVDLDKLLREATLILERIDGLVTFRVDDAQLEETPRTPRWGGGAGRHGCEPGQGGPQADGERGRPSRGEIQPDSGRGR